MTAADDHGVSLSGRLVLCAVAIEFCVSANVLTWLGVPYVTEGGALPLKIHPGTYVVCLAFVVHCAGAPRSGGFVWAAIGGNRLLAVYLLAIVACLSYALASTGKGNLIVLIDTFLPAGLAAAVLQAASPRERGALKRLLQWGIALNAALALGEAAMHASLVPLYLNEAEYHAPHDEFRPTALYDHPLTGGVMTLMGFALAPERMLLRWFYSGLLMSAMLAFGGRVAVAAAALSWCFMTGLDLGKRILLRDARAAHLLVSYSLVVLMGAACVVSALFAGFGTRLTGHLYWDPSAQVRLAQWHLLGELDASQLLFGASRDDLIARLDPLWLDYGVEVIENFWLLMFASLGAIGFPVFFAGFVSLLCWCWSRSNLRGRVLLVAVVLVASASNSLGRKSTLLVGLVTAICCVSMGQAGEKAAWRHAPNKRVPAGALINPL